MATARRSFADRLLTWFDQHQRDLPWRRTRDPWAIWVSEIMLQQTRVEAVRERYMQFLRDYPHPEDFAQVDDDELLAAWQGLGYYRRARLLRAGAQVVAERHGGHLPTDINELGNLPGIGDYTRGAIASQAFGLREIAVDGNVERVIARHRGIDSDVKRQPARRLIATAVRDQQDAHRPGDFNQALMELGAMVCTPRSPKCTTCPLQTDCQAHHQGRTAELPVLPPRRKPTDVVTRMLIATSRGKAVAVRVPAGAGNAGQIELPGPGMLQPCENAVDLQSALATRFGLNCDVGAEATTIRHGITHHRITLIAHWGETRGRLPKPMFRADPSDPHLPWSTASRKLFARLRLAAEGD